MPTQLLSIRLPVGGVGGAMYFGRAPYKQGVLSAKSDPSAGPNAPHYEIIYGVSPALTVA